MKQFGFINLLAHQIIKFMQPEQETKLDLSQDFRTTFNRIDYFCHVKEFKSLSQTKLTHIDVFSKTKKNKPADFYTQMRRLFLQMIYLYYVAYVKKLDIYVYEHYCINRWGVILKYYSLDPKNQKFMNKVQCEKFAQNTVQFFRQVWNEFKTKEQEEDERLKEQKEPQKEDSKDEKKKEIFFNDWVEFAYRFIDAICKLDKQVFTPKQFVECIQQTKHAKNNVMMIGVLTSTIFPLIKFNKTIAQIHFEICDYEPYIVSSIFGDNFSNEATTDFTNSVIRFFRALNDFKVLAITSSVSENKKTKFNEGESLLAEFKLNLEKLVITKQEGEKAEKSLEQQKKNNNGQQSSKTNSESDYNTQSEGKKNNNDSNLGQAICQYFWNKNKNQKELSFRVTVSIDKKICPLYWREVEDVWARLSEKWKVILDENKQLSGFNPGFVILSCNKESNSHQVTFTEYLKCQPIQSAISELIITTDKLIIAALAMRDVLCYFERKSDQGQMVSEQLVLNPGRLQDMAKSICHSVKNYYEICREVMGKMQRHKIEHKVPQTKVFK